MNNPSGSTDYYQGTKGETSSSLFDGFISQFNNSGTHVWCTYFGGSGDDAINGMDVDNTGNIFITGSTSSGTSACTTCTCQAPTIGEFPMCNPGGSSYFQKDVTGKGLYGGGAYDVFISKFSSALALTWSTYVGGGSKDEATAITVDEEDITSLTGNEVIVSITGQTSSDDMPLHSPSNTSNILNSAQKNSYIYPEFAGPSYYTSPWFASGSEAYIAMFTGSAIPLWGVCFGEPYSNWAGTGNERSNCILSTKDAGIGSKHIYLTGWTDNKKLAAVCKLPYNCETWPPDANISPSKPDAFNVRFAYNGSSFDGIQENHINQDEVVVFPNPATQVVSVKTVLAEKEEISITIYGITGEILFHQNYGKQASEFTHPIDVSSFSNGLYFLRIKAGNKSIGKKIIKQ